MAKRGTTTRRERFLPYRYERFGLELEPKRCVLDDSRTVRSVNVARHLVDLSEYRFSDVAVECSIELPKELIGTLFPPAERSRPPVRLVLAVRCPQTRLRRSIDVPLAGSGGSGFAVNVRLRRSDVVGSVELVPYLIRAKDASDGAADGYATARGARLASSRPWEIRFEALRPPIGAHLDIRYANFREDGKAVFHYPENLYQLDCESDNPILWLNLDHARISETLDSNANVGARARMRDVFFDLISQAVWTRLFLKAAHDVRETDEPPYDWEQSVLSNFLPALYPSEANHESRLSQLRDEISRGDESFILGRLDAVLQSRLDVVKHMTKLVEAGG